MGKQRRMSLDKGRFELGSVLSKANTTLIPYTTDPVISMISIVILSGSVRQWWAEFVQMASTNQAGYLHLVVSRLIQ